MRKLIVFFFLMSVSFEVFADVFDKQMEESDPELVPIFVLGKEIYEIGKDEDVLYKRNGNGNKTKIAETKGFFISRNNSYGDTYGVYKNKNIIYVYWEMSEQVGNFWTITAIDEVTGKNFTYSPPYDDIIPVAYVDDGHAYFAKVTRNGEDEVAIEIINVEPYGIGNNISKNVVAEKGREKGMLYGGINPEVGKPIEYDAIKINARDKNKVILLDGVKADNVRYEDQKTGKIYTAREITMYSFYRSLKNQMNEFRDSEKARRAIEFDFFLFPSPTITRIEKEQVYSALDPDDLSVLTIEEFCKDLKRRIKEGKGYWTQKRGNKTTCGVPWMDDYLKYLDDITTKK
jgi:hypothetical protein